MPASLQALGEDARAVVDVELIARAAVDVDAAQRLQVLAVLRDEVHGVVGAPALPALGMTSPVSRFTGSRKPFGARGSGS